MKTLNTSANLFSATECLLHQLRVKVCKSTIKETLLNHPDYPSILSISDTLKQWKVNNVVIHADKQKLNELPMPCIVHINSNGGFFSLLNHVSDTHVSYHKMGGG